MEFIYEQPQYHYVCFLTAQSKPFSMEKGILYVVMWTFFADVCVIPALIYILLGQIECLALQYTVISRDILNIMFLIFLFYISIPLIHCTTFDVCGYIKYMWFFPFDYTQSSSSSYHVQCDDK